MAGGVQFVDGCGVVVVLRGSNRHYNDDDPSGIDFKETGRS